LIIMANFTLKFIISRVLMTVYIIVCAYIILRTVIVNPENIIMSIIVCGFFGILLAVFYVIASKLS